MKLVLFVVCLTLSCFPAISQLSKPATPTAKELAKEKALAGKGNVEAMWHLAQYYYFGSGVPKNYATARQWLTKASAKNQADAMLLLGVTYEIGAGVKKDSIKALWWKKKAAESGSVAAAYDLGEMYESGTGVRENMTEAVKWYSIAAAKGDADAMIALGFCNMEGDGVPVDKKAGYDWFVKAAAAGEATAMRYLGDYYAQSDLGNDCQKALEWYMKAGDAGDSVSVKPVGETLVKDECAGVDKAAIATWMSKQAANGNHDACYYLGSFYVMGIGVKKDAGKGMELLIKDKESGAYEGVARNFSTNNLFKLYNSGALSAAQQTRLLEWFENTSISTNDDEMMAVVANIYINRETATRDDYKAGFDWATRSAERGNPGGCFWVGFMYYKGLGDIRRDDAKAFAWILKAAQKGDKDGAKLVSTFYEFGTGTTRNAAKAAEWKVKAEEME
jgi:uncharacterized protein